MNTSLRLFSAPLLFSALVAAGPAAAATINVPADQPTIQSAINVAGYGDDVLVAPGTYTWMNQGAGGPSLLQMKSGVWLHSAGGPDATILDAENAGRVIDCTGVDGQGIVEGFTLKRGYAAGGVPNEWGGGIYCTGSSALIRGNRFVGSDAAEGGAIFCYSSGTPQILNNEFLGNTARGKGGAIELYAGGRANIVGNRFVANSAPGTAGAIMIYVESFASLADNWFEANTAREGGAIQMNIASATLTGCVFTGNSGEYGSALHVLEGSSLTGSSNTFVGNVAT